MTRATGQLDQISEAIGEIRADTRNIKERIGEIEGKVSKLTRTEARGNGFILGLSVASGLLGSKLGAIVAGASKIFAG